MLKGEQYNRLLAIILGYKKKGNTASKKLVTNSEQFAKKITDIAQKSNVIINDDEQLASLLAMLKIDNYIPIEVYTVITKVMAISMQEKPLDMRKL